MTDSAPWRCALDNTVVSTLHRAGALGRVLRLWPGRWVVPRDVRDEAAAWRVEGHRVVTTLDALEADAVIELVTLDPLTEGRLYAQLQRTLGRGESAAIAVAFHRGLSVGIDDRRAQRVCREMVPPLAWTTTEGLLSQAIQAGLLARAEAEQIWASTGILDPARYVSPADR